MALLLTTYTQIVAFLDTLFYNPGRRFISDVDIQNLANLSAIQVARDLGGIRLLDDSVLTVAGTRDYAVNNQYRKLIKAQLIRAKNTVAEATTHLDILDESRRESLAKDGALVSLDGDRCGYIQFFPEQNIIRLFQTPTVAADVVRCWWVALPTALGPGVTYDGVAEEIPALVYKMCANGRRRYMEMNAGQNWDNSYAAEIELIKKFRRKQRQVLQMGVGQYEDTQLRSFDGGD
jgi:hypothetical protein